VFRNLCQLLVTPPLRLRSGDPQHSQPPQKPDFSKKMSNETFDCVSIFSP